MRYIPTGKLKPGMALGNDIYDGAGMLLMARHLLLDEEHIANLEFRGFPGIYIDDGFTRGIEIQQVLSPQVRSQALKLVHDFFGYGTRRADEKATQDEERIRAVVERVVEEILCNGDIMCNVMDIKNYSDYIYYHSVNVCMLSVMLGSRYGLNQNKLNQLATAGMLHDIGKRFIAPEVVMGKWPLTGRARNLWMKHPQQGADYLRTCCDFPATVYNGIAEHHEWYDGTGYPFGKSGNDIHIFARIIKLVDCYDAMVSERPGRPAQAPSEAVEYLMAGNGTEFDPELVNLFARKLWVYPKGCEVELSDGRRGIVARNFEDFPLRPLVKILHTGELLNLRDDQDARRLTVGKMIVK